jgi:CheY-like chemotaxis protein
MSKRDAKARITLATEATTPGTANAKNLPSMRKGEPMTNVADDRALFLGEAAATTPLPVVRIAIADDDPDSLHLLRLVLENPATEIYEATTGMELARLLLENAPFDLVVADILMPWMEGLQVLRSARMADVMTPVLVITGLVRPDVQTTVDRLGNARLLRKPFGIPELRAVISELMRRQRLS